MVSRAPLVPEGAATTRLRPIGTDLRFATLRTVLALMLREMSSTYGRSPGGYIWVILEPISGIILLAFIFSIGFRSPPLGNNFAIFYASGLLPFFMYLDVSQKVGSAIKYSRPLLSFPRVTLFDALMARLLLSVLTRLLITFLIFFFILAVWDTRTTFDLAAILLSCAMSIAFGAGVGLVNCVVGTRFPIWISAWGVLNRPMVIISGIIILPEALPQPYRDWLAWNPLLHITGAMHDAFYYSYTADYVDPAYVFGVSFSLIAVGLLFLWRFYRELLEL